MLKNVKRHIGIQKKRNLEKYMKVKRTQKRAQRQPRLHALIGRGRKVRTSTTSLRSLRMNTARAVLRGDEKLFPTAALHVVYAGIRRERVQSGNGTRRRYIKRLGKSLLYIYRRGKKSLESSLYGLEYNFMGYDGLSRKPAVR